ncbi:hypothetical protein AAMO2058_000759800 [Amorphochlora amoebiformis]
MPLNVPGMSQPYLVSPGLRSMVNKLTERNRSRTPTPSRLSNAEESKQFWGKSVRADGERLRGVLVIGDGAIFFKANPKLAGDEGSILEYFDLDDTRVVSTLRLHQPSMHSSLLDNPMSFDVKTNDPAKPQTLTIILSEPEEMEHCSETIRKAVWAAKSSLSEKKNSPSNEKTRSGDLSPPGQCIDSPRKMTIMANVKNSIQGLDKSLGSVKVISSIADLSPMVYPIHVFVGFLAMVGLIVMYLFGFNALLVSSLYIYPAISAQKNMIKKAGQEVWLVYFVVFGFFQVVESFYPPPDTLTLSPAYVIFKTGVLVGSILPMLAASQHEINEHGIPVTPRVAPS